MGRQCSMGFRHVPLQHRHGEADAEGIADDPNKRYFVYLTGHRHRRDEAASGPQHRTAGIDNTPEPQDGRGGNSGRGRCLFGARDDIVYLWCFGRGNFASYFSAGGASDTNFPTTATRSSRRPTDRTASHCVRRPTTCAQSSCGFRL